MQTELIALARAARRLSQLDPVRLMRLLAMAEAYVSLHDSPHEDAAATLRRCALISPRAKASA